MFVLDFIFLSKLSFFYLYNQRSSAITKQTLELQYPGLFALDEEVSPSQSGDISEQLNLLKQQVPDHAAKVEASIGEVVDFMSKFRADSIVKDAEAIKHALLVPQDKEDSVSTLNTYIYIYTQKFVCFHFVYETIHIHHNVFPISRTNFV